ncbi:MAG: hypothetical protein ACRD2P_06600 [Terriglobia bacterium]
MAINFESELSKQLGFLQRSCVSFDAGYVDEAMRIATVLRILLHDTQKSTSLLTHLGARSIKLLSTCPDMKPFMKSLAKFNGMGIYRPGGNPPYVPKLGGAIAKNLIGAQDWWTQIVFALDLNIYVSRRDIVLVAANKHGGAHVDVNLTPIYERLVASYDLFAWISGDGKIMPFTGHHYVALRQMGYEVLNSPDLLHYQNQRRTASLPGGSSF